MDLPAFALHTEPLRRKFYPPKPVLRSRNRALVFEGRRVFGEDFVSSEQALARLYSRRFYFWRGFRLRQVSLSAACVRISGHV